MLKEILMALLRKSGMAIDEVKNLSTAELLNLVKKIGKVFGGKEAAIKVKPWNEMVTKYEFKPEAENYIDRITSGEIPITVDEKSLTPALRVVLRANREKLWKDAAERNAEKIEEYYIPNEPVVPIDIDDALTLDIMLNPEKYKGYPWMIDRAKDLWGTLDSGEFFPF